MLCTTSLFQRRLRSNIFEKCVLLSVKIQLDLYLVLDEIHFARRHHWKRKNRNWDRKYCEYQTDFQMEVQMLEIISGVLPIIRRSGSSIQILLYISIRESC